MKNLVLDALHRGKVLTASVQSSNDRLLAWIGIYRIDLGLSDANDPYSEELRKRARSYIKRNNLTPPSGVGSIYRIRFFEMDKARANQDIYFCEDDLINKKNFNVYSEEDLIQLLNNFEIDISDLGEPWKTNYPI